MVVGVCGGGGGRCRPNAICSPCVWGCGKVPRGCAGGFAVADGQAGPGFGRGRRPQSEAACPLCSAPIPRPIQLDPNTLRPRGFVWVPRGWSPRIDPQIQAESQRDHRGAHRAPLLGRPENRALGIKIRATPRPETRPGVVGRSGRPIFISPKQNPMSKAYLVRFVWPKPYFFADLGPASCSGRTCDSISYHFPVADGQAPDSALRTWIGRPTRDDASRVCSQCRQCCSIL